MEPLLDRIADALRRHHEMLSELTLLADEFQGQVIAMRMMDSKLQRHMQRLDKKDGAEVEPPRELELPRDLEPPHEVKLPRNLEPPHEVKLPRDGNLSRFLKGRPQLKEE